MCQNHRVFLSKVARATVSRARERPDTHQVRSLRIPGRATLWNTHGYPYLAARTPSAQALFGEKSQNGLRTYPELLPHQLRPISTYPNPPICHVKNSKITDFCYFSYRGAMWYFYSQPHPPGFPGNASNYFMNPLTPSEQAAPGHGHKIHQK